MNRKKCGDVRSFHPRGKRWVFTYFLVAAESRVLFERLARDPRVTRFIIGLERGARTGRNHIQGYVEFTSPVRMTVVQGLWSCTWSLAHGTPLQNYVYCSKSRNYRTFGDFSREIAKIAEMQVSPAENFYRSAVVGEAAGHGSSSERSQPAILQADGAQLSGQEQACGSRAPQEIQSSNGGARGLVVLQQQRQHQQQQEQEELQLRYDNHQRHGLSDRRVIGNATNSNKEREKEIGFATIVNHLLDPKEKYGTMLKPTYVRNKRQMDEIAATFRELQVRHEFFEKLCGSRLRPWQSDCVQHVMGQDSRKICWYVDLCGNTGKSFLSSIYTFLYQFDALDGICADRDIAMLISDNPQGFVVDVSRANVNEFSYQTLESIKNGFVMTGKYQGLRRVFSSVPVVVFANFEPDRSQLSLDRWCIHDMDAQQQQDNTAGRNNASLSSSSTTTSSNDTGIPLDANLLALPIEPVPPPELPAVLAEAALLEVADPHMNNRERKNSSKSNNNNEVGGNNPASRHAAGGGAALAGTQDECNESVVAAIMHFGNDDDQDSVRYDDFDDNHVVREEVEERGEKVGTMMRGSDSSVGCTGLHWGESSSAAEPQQQSIISSMNDINHEDENDIEESKRKKRPRNSSPKTPSFVRSFPKDASTQSITVFLTDEAKQRRQKQPQGDQPQQVQVSRQKEQKIQHDDDCCRDIIACGADLDDDGWERVDNELRDNDPRERIDKDSRVVVSSGASSKTRKTLSTEKRRATSILMPTTATNTTERTRQENRSCRSFIRESKNETPFRQLEKNLSQDDDSVMCSAKIDVPPIVTGSSRWKFQQQNLDLNNFARPIHSRYQEVSVLSLDQCMSILNQDDDGCRRALNVLSSGVLPSSVQKRPSDSKRPSQQQVQQKEQFPPPASAAAFIHACNVVEKDASELSGTIVDDDSAGAMEIGKEERRSVGQANGGESSLRYVVETSPIRSRNGSGISDNGMDARYVSESSSSSLTDGTGLVISPAVTPVMSATEYRNELHHHHRPTLLDMCSSMISSSNQASEALSVKRVDNFVLQCIDTNVMNSMKTNAEKTHINSMIENKENCCIPETTTRAAVVAQAVITKEEERVVEELQSFAVDGIEPMDYDSDQDSTMISLMELDYEKGKSMSAEKRAKELAWFHSDFD